MKKLSWEKLKINALNTIKTFPVEIFLSICFFIAVILQEEKHGWHTDQIKSILAFTPLCWILCHSFNHFFSTSKKRWLYFSSVLFIAATPFITIEPFSLTYLTIWVIALALLFACRLQINNFHFTIDTLRIPYHIGISGILSLATSLLLLGIYASLIYIFDLETLGTQRFKFYLFAFPISVIAPFLFCLFQNLEQNNYNWKSNRFFDILNNWIVSPALICYTVLLYVYGIKILLTWDLPKGLLSYMIAVFLFIVVIARACQALLRVRHYDWFYKKFHFLVIPLLVLFWTGILYRIVEYGFTEERVYLFLLAILISVISLISFATSKTPYLYFLYLVILLLAPVTFIPAINAESLGLISQNKRLKQTLKTLDLIDPETGLIRNKNIPEMLNDSLSYKQYKTMTDIFSYIKTHTSSDFMLKKYGYATIESLKEGLFAGNLPEYIQSIENNEEYVFHSRTGNHSIPIKEYSELIDSYFPGIIENDSVLIKDDSIVLTKFDISNMLTEHPELLDRTKNAPDSVLYLKNDSCLAVVEYMNIRNGKIENLSIKLLLKK